MHGAVLWSVCASGVSGLALGRWWGRHPRSVQCRSPSPSCPHFVARELSGNAETVATEIAALFGELERFDAMVDFLIAPKHLWPVFRKKLGARISVGTPHAGVAWGAKVYLHDAQTELVLAFPEKPDDYQEVTAAISIGEDGPT